MENNRKMVVAISSGKGGVGKTSLAVNIAFFCSYFNRKVLLVDCDLCTRGASVFFYTGKFENANNRPQELQCSFDRILASACGMQPVNARFFPSRFLIKTGKSQLAFIPANADAPLFGSNDLYHLGSINEDTLKNIIHSYKEDYDLIILDLQAGDHKLNRKLMRIADRVVLVCEDDRISKITVESVFGSFLATIRNRLVYCVNKWRIIDVQHLNDGNRTILGISFSEEYAANYREGQLIKICESKQCRELADLVSKFGECGNLSAITYYRKVEANEKDRKKVKNEARKRFALFSVLTLILILLTCQVITVDYDWPQRILHTVIGLVIAVCIFLLIVKKKTIQRSSGLCDFSLSELCPIDSWAVNAFIKLEQSSINREKTFIRPNEPWN